MKTLTLFNKTKRKIDISDFLIKQNAKLKRKWFNILDFDEQTYRLHSGFVFVLSLKTGLTLSKNKKSTTFDIHCRQRLN